MRSWILVFSTFIIGGSHQPESRGIPSIIENMASEDMNKEESKQQSVSTQKKMDHEEHTSQHNSQQDKRLLKSF